METLILSLLCMNIKPKMFSLLHHFGILINIMAFFFSQFWKFKFLSAKLQLRLHFLNNSQNFKEDFECPYFVS